MNIILIIVLILLLLIIYFYKKIMNKYFRRNDGQISYNFLINLIQAVSSNNNYMNYGYWTKETRTLYEANKNLINLVLDKSGLRDKKNMKILDVGCGYGVQDIEWMNNIDNTCKITAVDISEEQINDALSKESDVKFEVCDAERIDIKYKNELFDRIMSVESAFHYSDRNKFYNNVNVLLKEDGKFIITDLMLKSDYDDSLITRIILYFFSDFLCIPKENLIKEDEWIKNINKELEIEEIIDITDNSFNQYYHHFMKIFFNNNDSLGDIFSKFFCSYQPFVYKVLVCSKKK